MAGLRLEHIYKVYPNGTKAVSDFTMDIEDKEFIVFVGPSGCGKSTTLRMIAGLEDISAGELYIGDRIVNDVEPKDRDIAMVFQNYALYPHMTVYENMAFGLKLRHVPNAEIHEKVLWAAKVLDLTEYLDRKPKAMSGGQRQRVALGRAILRNPKVMLLDEPLSNLDAKLRAQMRSEIAKLHEELQTTFIYVTHDQVEAMTLGTRVVVMKLGRVMQIDTPKNLYDYPDNLFVAGFIGTPQMNFFMANMTKKGEKIHIDFSYSNESLNVSQTILSKVQPQYLDGKKQVIVGVRCEDISLEPEVVAKSEYLINVKISHFEELGNETLIYGDINMDGDGFGETSTRVIIKGTSNYGLKKGEIVKAAVNVNKMHLFDKQTENSINPRVPKDNLVSATVKNHQLVLDELSYDLPPALNVKDGNYDVLIPVSAISLVESAKGITVDSIDQIEKKYVVGINLGKNKIFTVKEEEIAKDKKYLVELDFTQLAFRVDGEEVVSAIDNYDKVDAIFLNYQTAQSFVGDKYAPVIEERLSSTRAKYDAMLAELDAQYEQAKKDYANVDTAQISAKNQPQLQEKANQLKSETSRLKQELNENLEKLKKEHNDKRLEITNRVDAMYKKIKDEELDSFEQFKAINKDKDAYRKRAQEIRTFKSNFVLEKKNELDKQLNLEAVQYESDVNALKGTYTRTVKSLKKEYKDFALDLAKEANPIKYVEKEYMANKKNLLKEYQKAMNLANIVFFFKTDDLITLSSDDISAKVVQSLGIKVFTKQYLLEIPHDAYKLSDDGLELKVLEHLDFGTKTLIKCQLLNSTNERIMYLDLGKDVELQDKVVVTYDVTKIHITEKSMDIKIY